MIRKVWGRGAGQSRSWTTRHQKSYRDFIKVIKHSYNLEIVRLKVNDSIEDMGTYLTGKVCVACEGGVPPLSREEAEKLMEELNGWTLSDDSKRISKEFTFKNFAEALAFTNKVGELAEKEGHHPDIMLSWGKVGIALTTHAIKGLSENDYILAAKVDEL